MRDLTHQLTLSMLQANDTTHTAGGGYPTLPPNRTDLLDEDNSTSGSNNVVHAVTNHDDVCVLCVLLILCFHL